jgi:hypothetical protein
MSDDKKSSGGFVAKVTGGIFALLTAAGVPLFLKYSDRWFGPATTTAATTAQQTAAQTPPSSRPGHPNRVPPTAREVGHGKAPSTEPASPRQNPKAGQGAGPKGGPGPAPKAAPGPGPRAGGGPPAGNAWGNLITPKLATHFYSYGFAAGKAEPVRDDAVDPKLFEYRPDGSIYVPGEPVGSLVTRIPYNDYILAVEFKWGDKTYPPRPNRPRWAAILLHAQGADGSLNKIWMPGVACLLSEGDTGSLRLLGEPDQVKGQATATEAPGQRGHPFYYNPKAPAIKLGCGPRLMVSVIHRAGFPTTDKGPEELKAGYHPPGDLAVKPGDWNKVEISCAADTVSVRVNDKDACAVMGLNVKGGKIALVSDHADLVVRRFEVTRFAPR